MFIKILGWLLLIFCIFLILGNWDDTKSKDKTKKKTGWHWIIGCLIVIVLFSFPMINHHSVASSSNQTVSNAEKSRESKAQKLIDALNKQSPQSDFAKAKLALSKITRKSKKNSLKKELNMAIKQKKESNKPVVKAKESSEPKTDSSSRQKESSSTNSSSKSKKNVPTEYASALNKAEEYATTMDLSEQGLHDQLTSNSGEGFSEAAAQYALNNLKDVNWNKNALDKAEDYANSMDMSKQGIIDQLSSSSGEQFTASQAQYAVNHLTDVNWNENALNKAKDYQDMDMSKSDIREQLSSSSGEQFTPEQAQYAVNHLK